MTRIRVTTVPRSRTRAPGRRKPRGVVLVIALVLLTAISLMAASTLRNAISTEHVSGALRTTETALQAAEIALRYCERLAMASITSATATGPSASAAASAAPPLWQDLGNWDGASAKHVTLPLDTVNAAGAYGLYRRAPECLAEPLVVTAEDDVRPPDASPAADSNAAGTPRVFASVVVVTARGFGTDVPAQPTAGRPQGTEVWLQSQIEQIHSAGVARAPTRNWRQLYMR
jgi:type IV pilus assembly protein PilX